MKTWIRAWFWLCAVSILVSCTNAVYREEFNVTAPFEAYTRYMILEQNPFDQGALPAGDEALRIALDDALRARSFAPAARDEARPQQMVLALNYDIAAGRRRVQIYAANEVRTWAYQLGKLKVDEGLVALEIYERQTGGLLYRAEVLRGQSDAETVAALLSRFPPDTLRYRQALQRAQ